MDKAHRVSLILYYREFEIENKTSVVVFNMIQELQLRFKNILNPNFFDK